MYDTPRVRRRELCNILRQSIFVVGGITPCHRAHQPDLIYLPGLDINELLHSNSCRVDVQIPAHRHPSQAPENQRSIKKASAHINTLRFLKQAYLQGNSKFRKNYIKRPRTT